MSERDREIKRCALILSCWVFDLVGLTKMGFAEFSRGRSRRALAVLFCLLISLCCEARLTATSRQQLDVQKHLNRLNKPAVKSIKVFPFLYFFLLSLFNFLGLCFLSLVAGKVMESRTKSGNRIYIKLIFLLF